MTSDLVHELNNGVIKDDIEGGIKIFTDRLEWFSLADCDIITVKFSEIKHLKISSEIKDKLFIRLVLNDESNLTLKFFTNNFKNDIDNRNKIKTLLAKLMVVSKNNNDKGELTIAQKNELLTSNNLLYDLYKELVGNSLITSNEFWTSSLILKNSYNDNNIDNNNIYNNINKINTSKPVIPSQFWSSMVPVSIGCNEISLNLTTEYISAIFLAYPKVKEKFDEMVPDQISETDFWTQFFQAQYFYRERSHSIKEKNNMFLKIFLEADLNFKTTSLDLESNNFNIKPQSTVPEGYGEVGEVYDESKFSFGRRFNLQSHTLLKMFQDTSVSVNPSVDIFKSNLENFYIDPTEEIRPQYLDYKKFSSSACPYKEKSNSVKNSNLNYMLKHIEEWEKSNYLNYVVIGENKQENIVFYENLNDDISKTLIFHYKVICELLRILWSMFLSAPVNIALLKKKMELIENYYLSKFVPWLRNNLLEESNFPHISEMINAARSRFNNLKSR